MNLSGTGAFAGKLAVVTGGTRGIGAAITRAFLEAGAHVVAVYAANVGEASRFAAGLPDGWAARLSTRRLDVADAGAVEAFFGQFGPSLDFAAPFPGDPPEGPSILVNNAGIRRDAALALMPAEDWRRVLDVNLTGVYHMCKFALRAMSRARHGRIVNIASPSGRLGFAGQANYSAAKAGLVALSASLAKEVARRGVTVNCVSPGFIGTELLADLPAGKVDEYRRLVPLGRFGEPGEVAPAVLFLAGDGASYVTGATIEVTGGL